MAITSDTKAVSAYVTMATRKPKKKKKGAG